MEGYFYWPMIVLALLVLPLLLIEFHHVPEGWLAWTVDIGFGLIWLAFLVEFIIKIAIAESRVEYIKQNWLDVIIIILPLLRPLRLGSAAARTTRAFRLRGVGMKFARLVFSFIIGMEATERMLDRMGVKVKDDRDLPEEMTRHQLMDEVKQLRRRSDEWERWHEKEQAFLEGRGVEAYEGERPVEKEKQGHEAI